MDKRDLLDGDVYLALAPRLYYDERKREKILRRYELKRYYEDKLPVLKKMKEEVSSRPEKFLPFLFSEIIKPIPASSDEAEKELAALSAAFARPKFLFGHIADWEEKDKEPHFSYKALSNLLVEYSEFKGRLMKYKHVHSLCLKYIERGTTDLDRSPQRTAANSGLSGRKEKLKPDEKESLIRDINALYDSYYHSLRSCGYDCGNRPTADPQLVENCYEKDWLLPLAHVILIRDAQYQIMEKKKGTYQKATLLKPTSDRFCIQCRADHAAVCTSSPAPITYKMALAIRDVLGHHLGRYLSISPIDSAIQNSLIDRNENSLTSLMYKRAVEIKNIKQADLIFPLPDCDPEILAIKIGEALNLRTSQVDQLADALPDLLWDRKNVADPLKEIVPDQPETIQALINVVEELKKFLAPKRYYSKDSISSPLMRSAEVLGKLEILNHSEKPILPTKKACLQFFPFIVFRDLTIPVLLVSHAIEVEDGFLIPPVLKRYISKLKKILKKYCDDEYKLELTGNSEKILDYGRDSLGFLFQYEKEEISRALSWESAYDFLRVCVIKNAEYGDPDVRRQRQEEYLHTHYQDQLDQMGFQSSDSDMGKCICYKLFSCLLKTSLGLLQIEVLKRMSSLLSVVISAETDGNSKGGGPPRGETP